MSTTLEIQNTLGLLSTTGISVEKICSILDLPKKQLADAFGVSENGIREDRMSQRTKDMFYNLVECMEKVAFLLDKDEDKTKLWFRSPNQNFGGSSPRTLIIHRRFDIIKKFIDATSEGY